MPRVRLLTFAAALLIAGAALWPVAAGAGSMMDAKTGDLNADGVANSIDALLVMFFDAGLSGAEPSPEWHAAADVSCDDVVNAIDATLILQHEAGLYDLRP